MVISPEMRNRFPSSLSSFNLSLTRGNLCNSTDAAPVVWKPPDSVCSVNIRGERFQSPNDPLKWLQSTINIFPSITSFCISVFESLIVFIRADSEARTQRRSGPQVHLIWDRCGSWLAQTSSGENRKSVFDWAADIWHHRHAAHHDGSHRVTSGGRGCNQHPDSDPVVTEEPRFAYDFSLQVISLFLMLLLNRHDDLPLILTNTSS